MLAMRHTHPVVFWVLAVPIGLVGAFVALTIALTIAQHLSGAILVVVILAAYWAPTIVAFLRHHQAATVTVINALLGWTLIGWVVALAIACGDRRPRVVEVHHVP